MSELPYSKDKQLNRQKNKSGNLTKQQETKLKKRLITQADILYSKFIRARDGRCLYCGTDKNLQCSHFVSRRYFLYRWHIDNAITLCAGCHLYGWHGKDMGEYHFWLKNKYPQKYKIWEDFTYTVKTTKNAKPGIPELKEKIQYLKSLFSLV